MRSFKQPEQLTENKDDPIDFHVLTFVLDRWSGIVGVLRRHVPLQVFKRAITARAYAFTDAVLDLGDLSICCRDSAAQVILISFKLCPLRP